jgi:NAD(P)H-hydrate epimerase
MSGAAVLCASGALRGGAGLVRLAVPRSVLPLVAPANPCYMTAPLPEDDRGRLALSGLSALREQLDWSSVAVVGPGLGQSPDLTKILQAVVSSRAVTALVLDADALNALAAAPEVLRRQNGLILTPHPGEFARIVGKETREIQARREELAVAFARDNGVILVLKGHQTLVTDGRRLYVNSTGNPGMATGGTGDVLAGLLGGLAAQGLDLFATAVLGVYLHGLAGDFARDDLGETSLTATDLLTYLPKAIKSASTTT